MDILYTKITEIFNENKAVFTNASLPPVQQVDVYMGQPEDAENFEIFLPAIFMNWALTPTDTNGSSKAVLEFHVLQEPTGGSENFTTAEASLQYIQVLKKVKYLLNQLRAENTTPLKYKGEKPTGSEYFKYHVITYECQIDEDTASLHRTLLTNTTPLDLNSRTAQLKKKRPLVEPDSIIDRY